MTPAVMAATLWRRLAGMLRRGQRATAAAPAPEATSYPEHGSGKNGFVDDFLPLPNRTPFEMLPLYRHLRDCVPDISDAVWTWKRLCHTGHDVALLGLDGGDPPAEARAVVDALAARVHADDGGLGGLLDSFYAALFTYGAAALEVVPGRAREWIHDIVPVDVWTVRFRRNQGRLEAWQLFEGESVRLPDDYFLYVGLDRDGTNPYGRGMLRALPGMISVQQRLLDDMAKATRNAGWNKLHVRYHPEERPQDESEEDYRARMSHNLRDLRDRLSGAAVDQNLVTYDNVDVSVLGGDHRSHPFYENHKAVEEQVITGMHMMPVLMGRNYGSTETYGTAQFEVVNRQVLTVNRRVADVLTRIYNLELALRGVPARAGVRMRGNRTVDILKEATARGHEIDNALRLLEAGLADKDEARAALARNTEETRCTP